jgi:hypothetical protein
MTPYGKLLHSAMGLLKEAQENAAFTLILMEKRL